MPAEPNPESSKSPLPAGIPAGTGVPDTARLAESPEDVAARDRELVIRLTTFFQVPSDVL